ncbi:MAG: beta-lactamase family protein [Bacillaceae bacterium]|nr:beta-lactamase family protein [Bacillaceae bacterium]
MNHQANADLHTYMNALAEKGYFNGSILVAHQGHILLKQGYGFANVEHQIKNTPSTRFKIGSITKGFTAMAIFLLQEQGKLDINDCVSHYIENYPNGDQITLYHLLTNTSGIPDFVGFSDYWTRTMRLPSSVDRIITSFKNQPLHFEPGEQYEYSTSNYMLLTKIIEIVSDQSYPSFLKEHILRPLNMNHTGVDDGRNIVSNMASGYSVWENIIHTEFVDMSIPSGGYGMYSTVEDLYLWDRALYSEKLVSKESIKTMFTPNLANYGCGWAVQEAGNMGRLACHFGDINGFTNDFLRYIDRDITVIVLSNFSFTPVMNISRTLAKIVLGEKVPVPPSLSPLQGLDCSKDLPGVYKLENGQEIKITEKQGELYITVPKMYGALYKFKLIPYHASEADIKFYTEFVDERVNVDLIKRGIQYIDDNGQVYHGIKNDL